jgi:hypothetical protein
MFQSLFSKAILVLGTFLFMLSTAGCSQVRKAGQPKMKNMGITLELQMLSQSIRFRSEAILEAKVSNQGKGPFRVWEGINIAQPDQLWGEISLEITLDGEPYLDWEDLGTSIDYEWPKEEDVQILNPSQHLQCQGDLRYCYPLLKQGHYKIRGIFRPVRIRGLKLSVIKPVYSEWIEVVVL